MTRAFGVLARVMFERVVRKIVFASMHDTTSRAQLRN